MKKSPLKPLKKKPKHARVSTQKQTRRQRKKPIEERGFWGRLGAFLSGEMSRAVKRSARQNSPVLRSQKKK